MFTKRIPVLFIALIICCNLYGQFSDTAFIYTYGGIQNDVCAQIRATYDGGYIMIGTSNSFGCGNTDFYAVKIDSVGRHEWSQSYGGTENEEGFSVTPTFDKGYAFVGFTDSYGAGGYDVYLVKTDSMGNFQWQRTYGGSDWDFGYSIKQLSDSGFIICGLTYSYGGGNGNVYVIRTDKNGNTIWDKAIEDTNYYEYYSVGNAICVLKDSLYAIAGNFCAGSDTSAYFILMNDKGTVEQTRKYGVNHNYSANSITETLDHGFAMYGSSDSVTPGKPDEYMIKTDSVGNMKWYQDFSGPGIGIGNDVIQDSDLTYISVGSNNSYGLGGYALHVQHLDRNGNWIIGPSFGGAGDEEGNSIAIAKNGNVCFAGATNSQGYTVGLNDMYLVRIKTDTVFGINNYYSFPYLQYKDTTDCTLGIEPQPDIIAAVKIYPNPVAYSATILIQGTTINTSNSLFINIYNELGELIIENIQLKPTGHAQFIGYFERNNISSGIYIYRVINQEGTGVATGKIIVE